MAWGINSKHKVNFLGSEIKKNFVCLKKKWNEMVVKDKKLLKINKINKYDLLDLMFNIRKFCQIWNTNFVENNKQWVYHKRDSIAIPLQLQDLIVIPSQVNFFNFMIEFFSKNGFLGMFFKCRLFPIWWNCSQLDWNFWISFISFIVINFRNSKEFILFWKSSAIFLVYLIIWKNSK